MVLLPRASTRKVKISINFVISRTTTTLLFQNVSPYMHCVIEQRLNMTMNFF